MREEYLVTCRALHQSQLTLQAGDAQPLQPGQPRPGPQPQCLAVLHTELLQEAGGGHHNLGTPSDGGTGHGAEQEGRLSNVDILGICTYNGWNSVLKPPIPYDNWDLPWGQRPFSIVS